MFKAHNKDTRTALIASRRLGVFIVNFNQIALCSTVSISNFEQLNAD